MRAARDEGDIGARLRQRRAESPTDPAGADNRNTHEFSPLSLTGGAFNIFRPIPTTRKPIRFSVMAGHDESGEKAPFPAISPFALARTNPILAAGPPRGGSSDRRLMLVQVQVPSDRKARTRIVLAFACLFVVFVALSYGAWYLSGLAGRQDSIAARESQAALQGITEPAQIASALRQHPSNRVLQMLAMAMKAADQTDAAAEKLSGEVEQPPIPKDINLGAMNRGELEALRRNLKTAQANALAVMPRYTALVKAEREAIEKGALTLHADKETHDRLMEVVDRRQAAMAAFTAKMMAARAEFYRAYEAYVGVIASEFGAYKVVDGQFIFPLQRTVDRYNVAASAMTVATKRVVALEEERKGLLKSQQAAWVQLANGK
jgi:hypothetical protein